MTRVLRTVGRRRVCGTADRGFADVALFTLLPELGVAFVIRVKRSTKVWVAGTWQKLHILRFPGNTRRRTGGRVRYGARSPQARWVTMRRKREAPGKGGLWYVVVHRPSPAAKAVAEDAHRPGCEAGFREATWWRGVAQARLKALTAWSRLFAACAVALWVVASLATQWLVRGDTQARALLRRVVSRRCGRCALRLRRAMMGLLHQEPGLYEHLASRIKLKLNRD